MSNVAQLNLLKDQQVESWNEYEEWKAYQKRIQADAESQSLWGSIIGIVAGVGTFLATKNPHYAYAAYKGGSRIAQEVTEWTGYKPGYGAPDISHGKFNKAQGIKLNEDEEDRLETEKVANLIGIGSDLFSIITSVSGGGQYADNMAIDQAKSVSDIGSYKDAVQGMEVAEGGYIVDEAGWAIPESDIAALDISVTADGSIVPNIGTGTGLWDPKFLTTGELYNPVTGEITNPSFLEGIVPGGEPWEYKTKWDYHTGNLVNKQNTSLYALVNQNQGEDN